MAKPIHSMIRVLDEARSLEFYRRAFGMRIAERLAFDSFTLVYLVAEGSSFELELTINHDRTEPYAPRPPPTAPRPTSLSCPRRTSSWTCRRPWGCSPCTAR
jgi:catechol 2,3-dioxygenase-like lactoylglutathione lyase family enzyme